MVAVGRGGSEDVHLSEWTMIPREIDRMPTGPQSKQPPNPAGPGCLLFLALAFAGITLTFDAFVSRSVFYQVRALGYPRAPGVMTQSEVEEVPDPDGPSTFRPRIQYRYSVGGKAYTGNRSRYGRWSSSIRWARGIVAAHSVGAPVDVHYSPSDPSDATILAGVDGIDLYVAMFLLPFNLVAVALCMPVGQVIRARLQPRPLDGAAILDEGDHPAPVEPLRWRPLWSGFAASGVLALVGAFALGIGFGGPPPLSVMGVAWGAILGSGALAYACKRRRVQGKEAGDAP
jgi:hypothetical protein